MSILKKNVKFIKIKIIELYKFLQFVEKKRLELMERSVWGKF